jgi:peptidoglycan/LPS O-acetylase OafA/YrhL
MGNASKIKQITEISLLRPIFLLIIVLYHCICYYCEVWQPSKIITEYDICGRIAMPIGLTGFTFISGYLLYFFYKQGKYSEYKPFLINKTKRLILPFIFWGIIIQLLFKECNLWNNPLHLWYLPMIFLCYVIGYIICPLIKKIKGEVWLIIIFLTTILFQRIFNFHYIAFYFSIYFPFFILGMSIDTFNIKKKNILIIALFSLIILIILSILISTHKTNLIFTRGCLERLRYASCIGILIFLFKNIAIIFNDNIIQKPFWQLLNKYSMGIYIFHHIYLSLLLKIKLYSNFMDKYIIIAPLITFIIIISLSILTAKLTSRIKILQHFI